MNTHGILSEPGTLRFQRTLPGPIERVWHHLVDPDKRRLWLAAGPLDARVGGVVELVFRNAELSYNDDRAPEKYCEHENSGTTHGIVTRCDPPRLLAFTWRDTPGASDSDSEVTFELAPDGDQVRLTLTHRRLAAGAETLSVAGGWHTHLWLLEDVLAGREPRPFWRTHTLVEAEYAARGLG
ncbi:MAG TPA: SRPBCC family protein [Luteimonas sp.]|nr:SRPBCC family protein [Luteimonas sp.]